MILKIFSPTNIILETQITKFDFEALDGYFTILPRHVDFVSAMPPNISKYQTTDGKIHYIACNRGILVKKADTLSISVHKAVLSDDLKTLSETIKTDFKAEEEERKELNTAMARLEVGLTKTFMKLTTKDGSL